MVPLLDHLSLPRRVRTVARWPVGVARATWEYLTRAVPVHRTASAGDGADLPAAVPAAWHDSRIQGPDRGVGPLLHRRYSVVVDGVGGDAAALMSRFTAHPNYGVPDDVATFVKTRGVDGTAAVGDEFSIRMPGPWNGPVRVIGTTATTWRLATLDGHLEAGQIEFRARDEGGAVALEIESWARPGDVLSHVLYNIVGLAREVQLNLWIETLLRLAHRSGGDVRDGVHVDTRHVSATEVVAAG